MRIRVNDVEYDSWEDVPEDMRRLMERALPDADHNGIPDAVEGRGEVGPHTYQVRERTKITRVPVGPDGRPLTKKRWWSRRG